MLSVALLATIVVNIATSMVLAHNQIIDLLEAAWSKRSKIIL